MSTSSWLLCPLDTSLIPWAVYFIRQVVPGLSYTFHACWFQPINSDAVAGNAWGSAHLGPFSLQQPPHFPHWSTCCGWTCPCGSWLWPSGNFEMAKFIMHMSWRVQGMPVATQQGPRERARWIMSEPGPALLPYWGQWLGTWGFQSVSVGN